MSYSISFYALLIIAALSSLGIVLVRNVFKAALLLLLCLLALAGLYVLVFAELLAVTQIVVYAGGILVVILFGIMLTSKIAGKPLLVKNSHVLYGIIASAGLFTILASNIQQVFPGGIAPTFFNNNIERVGYSFLTQYGLVFEILGFFLLIALIAAAVTASFKKQDA